MSDTVIKLLNLVEKNYSLNEITDEMNMSRKQLYELFRKLRTKGMEFSKKYYENGDIVYSLKTNLDIPSKNNHVNIITKPESDSIRILLISDLHAGSIYERRDTWDRMINYCINTGIHIVLIPGDLVDGISLGRCDCKFILDPIEQLEHLVKYYPNDDSIINFVTFGNHDIDLLTTSGINIATYLQNYRHDIVPIGFGHGIVNIKNDRILMTHPLCINVNKDLDLASNYFLIKGHHHRTRSIIGSNGNCSLNVPSLSDIFLTENEFLPGAIDLSIKFKNGYFDTIYYEQLLIDNKKVITVNTTQFSVVPPKDRKFDGVIKYTEDRDKKKVLKKEDN